MEASLKQLLRWQLMSALLFTTSIEGKDGYFISMPSRKTPDGEYRDIVHPINTETREQVISEILKAFEKAEASSSEE